MPTTRAEQLSGVSPIPRRTAGGHHSLPAGLAWAAHTNEPATSMLSPETLLILTVPCQSAAQKAEFSEANTILLFLTQYLNTLMYVLQVNSEVNMYLHLV